MFLYETFVSNCGFFYDDSCITVPVQLTSAMCLLKILFKTATFRVCVFLRQYSVHLRQYCVFVHQYYVFLRQYCVTLVSTVFSFVSTVLDFLRGLGAEGGRGDRKNSTHR
jgi:hypothetical protein